MADLQFHWINANMLLLSYNMLPDLMGPKDHYCHNSVTN